LSARIGTLLIRIGTLIGYSGRLDFCGPTQLSGRRNQMAQGHE